MTSSVTPHVSTDALGEPDARTQQVISDGLDRYNEARIGPPMTRPVWVVARNDHQQVIGGLKAVSVWYWLLVDWVWVAEEARRQGVGSRLLGEAESAAIAIGCSHAFLNTFSFQAPDFYSQHGYEVFAQFDDFPAGNTRFWMRKNLKR